MCKQHKNAYYLQIKHVYKNKFPSKVVLKLIKVVPSSSS